MTQRLILSILLGLLLAACSAAGPRQIAVYPADSHAPQTIAPLPSQFVYDAYMEMEVSDPANASGRAKELAEDYGGYLVSSQTYHWDNKTQVTVVLAVPAGSFERLHTALLRLGNLKNERISGEWEGDGWGAYSQVTLNFQPSAWALPNLTSGWDPGRTFRRAAEVFITLFGFLADVLIWAAVVIGPFALLGWGAWALLRRLRRSAKG